MKLVPETDAEINALIAEARQLSVAAPVIIPMLEARKLSAYQRLLSDYRDNRPVNQNNIAILFVIDSLQTEIRSKLQNLNLNKG